MSKPLFSEEARRRFHEKIDVVLGVTGREAVTFSLMAYHQNGVRVLSAGKGKVCAEDFIRTDLRLLADKCRDMGTPNALAMLPAIAMCIEYIEHLHDQSNEEGVTIMDTTATEVRQ